MAARLHVRARPAADPASFCARGQRCRGGRARHHRGSSRRSDRGGDGRGIAEPAGRPGGGQATDGGPRVSGRPSADRGRALRRGSMIAPARIAAYEILKAVSSGRSDLPTAIASARDGLRDERDRAPRRGDCHRRVQLARALDHLIGALSKRPLDDWTRRSSHPPTERLSAAAPGRVPAAAVVDDAVKLARVRAKTSACGFRECRAAGRCRAAGTICHCRVDLRPLATRAMRNSTTFHHASHPSGWSSGGSIAGASTLPSLGAVQQQPASLTLRANRFESRRKRSSSARRRRVDRVRDALRPTASSSRPVTRYVRRSERFLRRAGRSVSAGRAPRRYPDPAARAGRCASPGGKTTALAAALNPGRLIASDVRRGDSRCCAKR